MKNLLMIVLFLLCFVVSGFANVEPVKKKHVLLLNSYSKGYAWTDNIVRGVENALLGSKEIILKVEYMDTKVINSEEYYLLLKNLYKKKYSKNKMDVIISSDDDALRFLRKYRDEIFPGAPVVFCGVNNYTESKVEGFSLYTGVNEKADFVTNLSLIIKLHPETKKIFVINDRLTTAGFLKNEFDQAAKKFKEYTRFIYLDDISFKELKSELSQLPEDSVVFYLSLFKDNTGQSYTPAEVIPAIANSSSVPVYGAVDYMLGHGIVGGMLKSSYFQGDTVAKLALRVINGEDVSTIPVITQSPNQYMFDYNWFTRWDIDRNELPEESIIINEPETFYYKYKELIWTASGIFAGLLWFIVVLLFNIKKRKRAQRGLQTIINSTSSILNYQSIDTFRKELSVQLSELFPIQKSLLLFRHKPENLVKDVNAFPDPVSDNDLKAIDDIPENVSKLIIDSTKNKKCSVQRKNGVAYFKSSYLPGNMTYFQGKRGFDDLDRDLLEIFTNNITMSIDNIEKHKIERALETAKQIQMSMLPKTFSDFSEKHGIDLHAFLTPAKEVGGDLYDFFEIDDEHLCFVVGDVSDKGVPAALFMAMAKSLIRSAAEDNLNPEQIIAKANKGLSRDNDMSMFVTVFLAIFNKSNGNIKFTNAGHNPPYIVSAKGEVRQIKTTPCLVMGVYDDVPYTVETAKLEKGDGLYIYSDGVTEAANKREELFEEARLEDVLKKHHNEKSKQLNDKIIEELGLFVDGAPQSDDITMLFVRY